MTTKHSRRPGNEATISAAEFKATCLSLMEEVSNGGRAFTVTKRGKRVARLVPVDGEEASFVGFLSGCVVRADRIDEPTGERWEAEPE